MFFSVTAAPATAEPFGSLTTPRNVALPVVCASAADAPPASRQRQSAKAGAKPMLSGHLRSRSDRADEGGINLFIFIYPPILIGDGLTAISYSYFVIFCAPYRLAGPHTAIPLGGNTPLPMMGVA